MRLKPYYRAGGITLYHGDCEQIIPRLPPLSLIFTSPPYNLAGKPWPKLGNWKTGDGAMGKSKWRNGSDGSGGVRYNTHGDGMPWPEYVAWQHRILTLLWNQLSETGAIFYNHKPRVMGAKLWLPLELNPGLPLRQIIVWARSGGLNFNPTAYVPTHEWIMILAKERWRLRSKAVSGLGDVWREKQCRDKKHPATFPLALPLRAIESTMPGLVCDPFCGVGTTLLAARELGSKAIGIEKDEKYCEEAALRLSLPLSANE